jgi:FkbM family methyltransferase
MIRTHVNRLLARPIAVALVRLPALEQFVRAATDERKLQIALRRLRKQGLEIPVVYDIGAHRGEWTKRARASLPSTRFFLFEANAEHEHALEDVGERCIISVLSSRERAVDFYATGGPGDSYYREESERYGALAPRRVSTTTLDDLVEKLDLPVPDLIKVDVQGAELDVLRGGRKTLTEAKLVLLECPVTYYNKGAPNIHEYLRFMEGCGFGVVDFLDQMWQRGRMIHVDVLFARLDIGRVISTR